MRGRASLAVLGLSLLALMVAGCADPGAPDREPDVTGVVALVGTPSAPVLTEPSDAYFEGMSLLRGDPVLVDGEGRPVPYDQLQDGDAIEVWTDGPCAESFPVQCPVTALRVYR